MAEMLVEQYSKVFSTPKEPLQQPQQIFTDQNWNEPELSDFDFSVDDLIEAISEIFLLLPDLTDFQLYY